jgi:hypothetical protein
MISVNSVATARQGKNQVIAVFDLGEEEPVLTAGLLTLLVGEEGGERGQAFLAAGEQILAVSESASCCRRAKFLHFRKALESFSKSMFSSF